MAEPSLRYVIIHVRGETRSRRTEYILGRNSRSEFRDYRIRDGDPNQPSTHRVEYGPPRALILNRDINLGFHLDFESCVYRAFPLSTYGGPSGFRPPATTHQPSGRTVHVQTETIDTGERKEMLAHRARRVIIRITQRFSPENDTRPSETETDGWYIDPPAAWLAVHPPNARATIQSADNGQFATPVFTDIGPRETGFPLLVIFTGRSSFKDAEGNIRVHTSGYRQEVTEFSEQVLGGDLFVPPRSFRKVAVLPGEPAVPLALRMQLGWQNFKHKLMAKW